MDLFEDVKFLRDNFKVKNGKFLYLKTGEYMDITGVDKILKERKEIND